MSLVAGCLLILVGGCVEQSLAPAGAGNSGAVNILLPDDNGSWVPTNTMRGRLPVHSGTVEITGVGRFSFDPVDVRTVRPDVFADGQFSLFDAVVRLQQLGDIQLEYHYDGDLATNLIDSINGIPGWWYEAYYSGGWPETDAFRMDMFPWKDGTVLEVHPATQEYLGQLYASFADEVQRLAANDGRVIVPEVTIQDPSGTRTFDNVVVTSHGVRTDMLQQNVVTALDILLSLGEQGRLSVVGMAWYSAINFADPIESYFVERIDDTEAFATCGYVYEVGAVAFSGIAGNHIHIPSDVRALVSPEYAYWFWLCL